MITRTVSVGQDLDAQVSEKLFQNSDWDPYPPRYSTDIGFAWKVVEKLRQQGWLVVIKELPEGFPFRGDGAEEYQARCYVGLTWMPNKTSQDFHRGVSLRPVALADTTPEAICKCALEAVRQLEKYG